MFFRLRNLLLLVLFSTQPLLAEPHRDAEVFLTASGYALVVQVKQSQAGTEQAPPTAMVEVKYVLGDHGVPTKEWTPTKKLDGTELSTVWDESPNVPGPQIGTEWVVLAKKKSDGLYHVNPQVRFPYTADNLHWVQSQLAGSHSGNRLSVPMRGEVRLFAGDAPPQDWLFCDGQRLQTLDYRELWTVIETKFGGDGWQSGNYLVPDLSSLEESLGGVRFIISSKGLWSNNETTNLRNRRSVGTAVWYAGDKAPVGTVPCNGKSQVEGALAWMLQKTTVPSVAAPSPLKVPPLLLTLGGERRGRVWRESSGDGFLGEIRLAAGPVPPRGWGWCDGGTYRSIDFPDLFSIVGKSYGANSEQGTFAIPDLQKAEKSLNGLRYIICLQGRTPTFKADDYSGLGKGETRGFSLGAGPREERTCRAGTADGVWSVEVRKQGVESYNISYELKTDGLYMTGVDSVDGASKMTYSPPRKLFPVPMEKGTTWTNTYTQDGMEVVETGDVVGLETVEVPAGKFDCMKINLSTEKGTLSNWYAKKVGLVRSTFAPTGQNVVFKKVLSER